MWCVTSSTRFGRLASFSYLEYLRIMRLNLDCDQLFLEDMKGSQSHRNGLAKVLGRDDLDWHGSNPTGFNGKYTPEMLAWLNKEAALLLAEASQRAAGKPYVLRRFVLHARVYLLYLQIMASPEPPLSGCLP